MPKADPEKIHGSFKEFIDSMNRGDYDGNVLLARELSKIVQEPKAEVELSVPE